VVAFGQKISLGIIAAGEVETRYMVTYFTVALFRDIVVE
jgi:hypothetical protein